MIPRHLEPVLRNAAEQLPVVTLTGARQSGKTTLARAAFPDHHFVTLEDPDHRAHALEDPRGFLARHRRPVIIDEAQRAPDLFSYLQGVVDADETPGGYVLTGSQNFLLLKSISQSLAGRAMVLHLLPLSLTEIARRPAIDPEALVRLSGAKADGADGALEAGDLWTTLHRGFFPRVQNPRIDAPRWLRAYRQTYLERDVREIVSVSDLDAFDRFLRLAAGRNGHILDIASLASDVGASRATTQRWLSVLVASFVAVLLRPRFQDWRKRHVRRPKLYFLDTGLLCSLLAVRSPGDLEIHAERGAVFESFVLSELLKARHHAGDEPDVHFFRDSQRNEVDFIVGNGERIVPIEAKSGMTLPSDALSGLDYWRRLVGDPNHPAALVHGGDDSYIRQSVAVRSWRDI